MDKADKKEAKKLGKQGFIKQEKMDIKEAAKDSKAYPKPKKKVK
jgi:hypothetical protein